MPEDIPSPQDITSPRMKMAQRLNELLANQAAAAERVRLAEERSEETRAEYQKLYDLYVEGVESLKAADLSKADRCALVGTTEMALASYQEQAPALHKVSCELGTSRKEVTKIAEEIAQAKRALAKSWPTLPAPKDDGETAEDVSLDEPAAA